MSPFNEHTARAMFVMTYEEMRRVMGREPTVEDLLGASEMYTAVADRFLAAAKAEQAARANKNTPSKESTE